MILIAECSDCNGEIHYSQNEGWATDCGRYIEIELHARLCGSTCRLTDREVRERLEVAACEPQEREWERE